MQARASDRLLASVTTASADAILSLNRAGGIESWNRGAEQIFCYAAQQVRGQRCFDLLSHSPDAAAQFQQLTEKVHAAGFVRGHEMLCQNCQGEEVMVELTATCLTDEMGQPIGMSVILRDITRRKQHEGEIQGLNARLSEQVAERTRELAEKVEQLARANAELRKMDQMRAEFVSLVSHQIRAPLTNMLGASERMQGNCSAINATCARMFVIFEQQVKRLNRLVHEVLNATRLEAGELVLQQTPIPIMSIVQQVVDQVHAGADGRRIRLPAPNGLPLVYADRDRVVEVLANLLDNADKYSPPGTDIAIEARADQGAVTLCVRDAGRGLPPDDLERVFEKFYRADNSDAQMAYGYGLGLYVCRQLVEAHGGRIWAENDPASGAVFSFTLPVAP